MSVSGILPVNKPEGLRSTDCVQKIRSILGRSLKVGHGGTLDSTASGLLVILVGQATRLSNFVMELPKVYEAEVALGRGTTTDDASGETTERAPWGHVTDSALDSALCAFFGWRMQRPPAVSAVHVGGERAHAIARSGRSVLPPYAAGRKRACALPRQLPQRYLRTQLRQGLGRAFGHGGASERTDSPFERPL